MTWTRLLAVIALTVAATLIVVLVLQNLTPAESLVEHRLEHHYGVGDDQFRRTMGALLAAPILPGNTVEHLANSDEIFPAMLAAIAAAERTVCFETFVYWRGDIARQFSDALAERARAGVAVHVLLDWFGFQGAEDELLELMRSAGAEVEMYNPLAWYQLDRLNNRTHRKILVVDGRVGFTGGVGIADEWLGDAQDPDHWRDSHFRVEGPIVAQLQGGFMDNWLRVREKVLDGDGYFPPLQPRGPVAAQVFLASQRAGGDSMRLMMMLALNAAERSIDIGSAYFVPDDFAVDTLVAARARGVAVRIVVPGPHMDSTVTGNASRARWGELLEAGVEIWEYQPTMYHAKLLVVDESWVSVGSTNFDPRSFALNDEANLNAFDAQLAGSLAEVLRQDRARARLVTFEAWRNRPWREKLAERLASLLGSQL